jgi:hypothetical protein
MKLPEVVTNNDLNKERIRLFTPLKHPEVVINKNLNKERIRSHQVAKEGYKLSRHLSINPHTASGFCPRLLSNKTSYMLCLASMVIIVSSIQIPILFHCRQLKILCSSMAMTPTCWSNLASLKKSDYLVCYFGTSGFDSFRAKSRKELNLKIWRSKVF